MKKYNIQIIAVILIGIFSSCKLDNSKYKYPESSEIKIHFTTDYNKFFDECKTGGSFLIYDQKSHSYTTNDTLDINKPTIPASTFKIINLLIALETGVIKDEKEVIQWPGSIDTERYGLRKNIWRDMTVEEAFIESAGWAFIELAKRIGREKYGEYLGLCNYGNQDLSEKGDDFWNFGAFGISPLNQIDFLRAVYEEQLPFSKRNYEILKRVMLTEENKHYTISSKTGWSGRDN